MNRSQVIEAATQEFRHALRMLRKSPGFSAIAMLSLALGIGVNTTMFSVINAVLLGSIPFQDPDRLVRLVQQHSGSDVTIPEYQFVKDQQQLFSSVAAYRGSGERRLDAAGKQSWITVVMVSTDFLRTLGMQPAIGREFRDEETRTGGPQAIVISDGVWRANFGADPGVLGQSVTLNNTSFTVVGVLPSGFWLPQAVDALVPLRPTGSLSDLGSNTQMIARLRDDVAMARAQADIGAMANDLRRAQGGNVSRNYNGLSILTFHAWLVGDVRLNLILLFGATALLLLISCANVAMLLLARTAGRVKEIGVRIALGGQRRLLLQFLTENLIIATLGAAVGVLAAYQLVRGFVAWVPFNIPVASDIEVDVSVLAFTVIVSLVTAVIFTLVPLSSSRRLNVQACLQSEGRNVGAGSVRARTRNVLVVSEVAISTMLLIASGLLIQSLYRLHQERLGFSPERVVTFETPFAPERANNPIDRLNFTRALLERLKVLPGVEAAAATSLLPLTGQSNMPTEHEGHPEHSIGGMEIRAITPEYFATMGIPLRAGRSFDERDAVTPVPIVIVNETVARVWWPQTNPIGDRIVIGRSQGKEYFKDTPREVIGIVGDTKSMTLQAPARPTVYVPLAAAFASSSLAWAVRTDGNANVAEGLYAAIAAIDPSQRVRRLRSMNEIVASTSARSRFNAELFGIFAGVALVLAALGLYGVLSFLVTQRRQEIGTRMALGASRPDVIKVFLGQGLLLTLAGLGIGIGGALLVSRWLSSLLFGVKPTDPVSFVAVSIALIVVAAVASYLPARRAAAIDPMMAMRAD